MTTNQSNRKSLTGLVEGATASSNLDITGNVNMKGFKLFNLGLGTDLQDSTNKTQLDAVVSDISIIDNSISIIEISLNNLDNHDASFQAIDASLQFLDLSGVQFSLGVNKLDISVNKLEISANKYELYENSLNFLEASGVEFSLGINKLDVSVNKLDVSVNSIDTTNFINKDGSVHMAADLNMGDFEIVNLKEGLASSDAVNYGQLFPVRVDVVNISAELITMKAGISELNLTTISLEASANIYEASLNSIETNFINKDGSVHMAADLNMGDFEIVNLKEGWASSDAVNYGQLFPVRVDVVNISAELITMNSSISSLNSKTDNLEASANVYEASLNALTSVSWTASGDNLAYNTGGIDVSANSTFGNASVGHASSADCIFSHKDWIDTAPALTQLGKNSYGSVALNCSTTADLGVGSINFAKDRTTTMMTILGSNGKVGIGTLTPNYTLTVKGTSGNVLRLEGDTHAYMAFHPKGDTAPTNRYAWFGYGSDADATAGLLTLGLERGTTLSNNSAGFKVVGFNGGVNFPLYIQGYKVNGGSFRWVSFLNVTPSTGTNHIRPLSAPSSTSGAHMQNRMSVSASHGFLTNTGYLQASDDRIKSFEKPIEVGLKEILQLEPKHYLKHPTIFVDADDETGETLPVDDEGKLFQTNEDGEKEPLDCEFELGLISQAVEKIKGLEILVTDEINGIKNVNYVGLVPVLVKAIQEMEAKRKEDNKKFIDLNKRMIILEEKLKNIEAEGEKEYIL